MEVPTTERISLEERWSEDCRKTTKRRTGRENKSLPEVVEEKEERWKNIDKILKEKTQIQNDTT